MTTTLEENNWFRIQAQERGGEEVVEVLLYDEIFDSGCDMFGGVCPAPFVEALAPYRERTVVVRINSPGGSVFAANAIYNYLRTFPKIWTINDSLAASGASLVLLAAPRERRAMAHSAWVMIHEASGFAYGPAAVLEKTAAELRQLNGVMVETYARETGQSADSLVKALAEETWYTAEQALAAGFIGAIINEPTATQVAPSFKNSLSRFRHVPQALRGQERQQQQTTMQTITAGGTAPTFTQCGCGGTPPAATTNNNQAELDALKSENEQLKKDLEKLKADDETAKKARAETAVKAAIDDGRLQPILRDAVLQQYLANEEATVAILAKLVPAKSGTEPISVRADGRGGHAIQTLREQINGEPDVGKRMQLRASRWDAVLTDQ